MDPDAPRYRDLRRLVAGDDAPAPGDVTAPAPPDPNFDVERWLNEIGWDTEFHSWNEMTAHLGRPTGSPDPRIGNIAAVRR
ncbi:hypothetical protein [Nocardia seriolae]|uniref:Uncharacterized protein n=1 Tax=Nocardia seriolae TaxID=37332 RepID=A0ABC8B2Y5_9NOCA|nr:hypothetical protein [Nocardia seriolae]APB00672.1 hypothetical protein NS506_06641 [Nocardia seriolae]OJF79079.1 hypothetical protein NS14008_07475 [Nocardia seriolae]WKY50909.1 hypothetical protein Q5P07_28615 [Nocardia seriolae]WNJ57558.1 hypothetical protein RMO66_29730 [Nocardia seriolae]BAW05185.1 methyltransferase [Nocardia seriolae]